MSAGLLRVVVVCRRCSAEKKVMWDFAKDPNIRAECGVCGPLVLELKQQGKAALRRQRNRGWLTVRGTPLTSTSDCGYIRNPADMAVNAVG